MDQIRIGTFLKELRKDKELTQEQLAEELGVSGRTVSRWETGSNMPDIGMLVELADLYGVSIPEIISGERKSEEMDRETRETAVAMAEYGRNQAKVGKRRAVGYLAAAFGIFIIISALAMFPSESSWGSVYATLGSIILIAGVCLAARSSLTKRIWRILLPVACAAVLFAAFTLSDYMAVEKFGQVPRFRYETGYDSEHPDRLVYKKLFFKVVQENPGAEDEHVYIVK